MPDNELTVIQICGACGEQVGSFSIKKDNLMLVSKQTIWCPACQADRPEVRDLAGRRTAIQKEQKSYARNEPADAKARPAHRP